jgi:hypothetical protein
MRAASRVKREMVIGRILRSVVLVATSVAAPPFAVIALASDVIFRDGFEGPPPTPANDTCATATPLTLSAPMSSTTIGANNNYDSGLEVCTGYSQPGADVAFSIVLLASNSYTVTLSNPAVTFDPSISLIGPGSPSVCNTLPITCLAGADSGVAGAGESFQFTPSSAGTYYIIVDSFYSGPFDGGGFTIQVTSP